MDLAQGWIRLEKLPYGVGMEHNFENMSYCVGVVTYMITTPTQYDHFFRTYAPLPHHMATFQAESTLGPDPPPIVPTWPDLGSDGARFVQVWSEFGSDSANLVQFSTKFGSDSALFV